MPIYFASLNEDLLIRQITGTDKTRLHLQNLGFTVGETVRLVAKVDNDVILKIKGVSLALTKELAKRILV